MPLTYLVGRTGTTRPRQTLSKFMRRQSLLDGADGRSVSFIPFAALNIMILWHGGETWAGHAKRYVGSEVQSVGTLFHSEEFEASECLVAPFQYAYPVELFTLECPGYSTTSMSCSFALLESRPNAYLG